MDAKNPRGGRPARICFTPGCKRRVKWTRCAEHQPPRLALDEWLARFWAEPLPADTQRQLARRDSAFVIDQLATKRGPAYDRLLKLREGGLGDY
jgi:hypothetical protein